MEEKSPGEEFKTLSCIAGYNSYEAQSFVGLLRLPIRIF